MRFRQGPDGGPEVRLLAPENILSDIQTKACEVELEMFVGQEPEIEFELCGVKWVWKALDQTLNCQGYKNENSNGKRKTVSAFLQGHGNSGIICRQKECNAHSTG